MKRLKVLLLAVCFIGISREINCQLTVEEREKLKPVVFRCMDETSLTLIEVLSLRTATITQMNQNPRIKCYINCIMEQIGIIIDGEIQEERLKEFMMTTKYNWKLAPDVVSTCNSIKKYNKCETAFSIFDCYERNKMKLI